MAKTTTHRKKTSSKKTESPVSKLLDYTQTDETEKYIQNVISYLPKNKFLYQFADLFLHSMSQRDLETYSHSELAEFTQERFDFFKKAFLKDRDFQIKHHDSENKTIFELVMPDASFLTITLESLFRELNLRIFFRLHPMMTVTKDKKGNLAAITAPFSHENRMVFIYIEFEEIAEETLLSKLHSRIESHLCAIETVHRDNEEVLKKLISLKKPISQTPGELSIPKEEWVDLLDWLSLNFSFTGYVAFPTNGKGKPVPIPGSGLGIFSEQYLEKDFSVLLETLTAHVWQMKDAPSPFVFDTIKVKSPMMRFENLMRLSLKIPNRQGKREEHMFFGLIKRSSLQAISANVPVVRYKMNYIFKVKNMLEQTHDYDEVVRIFSNIPLLELFRTSAQSLLQIVEDLFSINDPHQIHCFIHNDSGSPSTRILVAVPTPLFSKENIRTIVNYLENQAPHSDCEVIEVRGVNTCRLHVYFDLLGKEQWTLDTTQLDAEISKLIKPWEEKVRQALSQQYPGNLSERLYERYLPGMPPHYRVRTSPANTVRDIMFLEQLVQEQERQFDLTPFDIPSPMLGKVSLLFIYSLQQNDLFHVMPVLQNMGFYVVDQLNARIGNQEETYGYIQSLRVQDSRRQAIDVERHKTLIVDMLTAIFDGRTENDPLNALTMLADLDWRAINVLQLYRNLYLQLGGTYTREKANSALQSYPGHARQLFEYFEAKFSPAKQFGDQKYRKEALLPGKQQIFIESLRSVEEVADDVILRRLFNLLESTLRTSFYIPRSGRQTSISIKLDSHNVHEMPVPVPYREIYVHDVGMEGVHLRFGPVARGGLRWSDRLDDFRTEILGLVKTQQTKNVVIVPVGSKGGFVIKKQLASREEAAAESQKQYQKFISALLDITDNLDASGQARHPSHVLPYDDLDPYFVVAADKGTATFSDTANAISAKYKFWLDDAFASGGSVGYDHKKEGITARGAWECVKLHFKEKGKDIQTEPTTVAGIGDMGGDVFGNGMLLSKALKLQAAFNHLHIFLDPDPDPEISWQERKRLFVLPRSTWKDYNASLISTGGGIYDRKAKEITLSPQVKTLLGVEQDVLNGEEMIRAILKMEVELLWFGGIGTYIKSSDETDFQVGDTANDAVRISVPECRAQVIGEGANLGLTQLARIEFDKQGNLNTDAIDNSAGVNMSDYEVNIKILLQQMLREKHLKSMKDRNEVLVQATDEVSELVLANNRGQHRLISMDVIRSQENFKIFKYLIRYLITEKGLNDQSERIPSRGAIAQMDEAKEAMPRPIMAVLQAYVKMSVYNSLLEDRERFDDPYLETTYEEYFPETIRKRFGKNIRQHPLKGEIIGTTLTNQIVNQAGITFFYRMEQLTGKSITEIVVAYLIFDESLDGADFRARILATGGVIESDKYLALILFENILQMLIQSLLQHSTHPLNFKMISKYKTLLSALKTSFSGTGENLKISMDLWQGRGFSSELAQEISIINELGIAPDVIYLHEQEHIAVPAALQLILQVNEVFSFQWLTQRLQAIELATDWDQSHQDILLKTTDVYKASMIRLLLKHHNENALTQLSSEELIAPVSAQFAVPLATYFQTINQLQTGSPINLTTLSVCINRLNFLDVVPG